MKAQELRIGNLLLKGSLNIDTGGIKEEIVIVDYHILYEIINGSTNYQYIPLTEDWLIKLGASRHPDNNYHYYSFQLTEDFSLDFIPIGNNMFKLTIVNNLDIIESQFILNYVHQVYNLIYSLTGEELIIK